MSMPEIKEFLKKNEAKIALFIGFLLVSGISFEVGVLRGQKWQSNPLIIEKRLDVSQGTEMPKMANFEASESNSLPQSVIKTPETKTSSSCAYVGSKNSTKFYLSTCSWAKKIKPENLICFSNPEEALKLGRTESKCN